MSNKTKIAITFWVHFAIATMSHVAGLGIIGGLVSLVTTTVFTFWLKCLFLGMLFFLCMYCVNHLTNSQGFCVVTDIENYYRKLEGMPKVGPYTPRYYAKCGSIIRRIKRLFSRKPKEGKK